MRKLIAVVAMTVVSATAGVTSAQKPPADRVELTNTYDAFGRTIAGVEHDFGFSTVVEYRGKTILFDAGTDARKFERNARALKIDLRKVDIAIVSHGHYDHIGGFDALLNANPKVKIYLPNDFNSIGAPTRFPFRDRDPDASRSLSPDELYFRGARVTDNMLTTPTGRFWRSNVEFLTQPKEVLPGVTIVPTVSRLMGTFIKYPPFEEQPQFVGMPELSLSLETGEGQVIIVGCSHTGVENIVAEVKKVRSSKVRLVAGGFHLLPYDAHYIDELAARMKGELGVAGVAPAHCTGHRGFVSFKSAFGANYRFFGLGETILLL